MTSLFSGFLSPQCLHWEENKMTYKSEEQLRGLKQGLTACNNHEINTAGESKQDGYSSLQCAGHFLLAQFCCLPPSASTGFRVQSATVRPSSHPSVLWWMPASKDM